MLDLLVIAAMSTPRVFANEYCWARHYGAEHQQALIEAENSWGGLQHTETAEQFMRENCTLYTEWS